MIQIAKEDNQKENLNILKRLKRQEAGPSGINNIYSEPVKTEKLPSIRGFYSLWFVITSSYY